MKKLILVDSVGEFDPTIGKKIIRILLRLEQYGGPVPPTKEKKTKAFVFK
jgi:hypothetical protein